MNTNTNETCISYFARVYGIDFTRNEDGSMGSEAFAALGEALRQEMTSAAEDACAGYGYPAEAVYPGIEDGENEGINDWAYATAQQMGDADPSVPSTIADLRRETKELAEADCAGLDTDDVFIESVYAEKLAALRTPEPVRYYITRDAIRRDSEYYTTADDVIGNWTMSVEETSGEVPEGAVEVVFETNVEELLDQEYRVDRLGEAIDIAWALHEEISLNKARDYDTPVAAFCYADDDGWDKVQAILDSLPGRN